MKFPRFYNPFAVIRSLKNTNAALSADLSDARSANYLLRQQRDIAIDLGQHTVEALVVADQVVDAHADYIEELRDEVTEARTDAVAIVAWVKAVETSLSAAGITIQDGENGPSIIVNEDSFFLAARGSTDLGEGRRLLAA